MHPHVDKVHLMMSRRLRRPMITLPLSDLSLAHYGDVDIYTDVVIEAHIRKSSIGVATEIYSAFCWKGS